jgi:lipopolysaccharide/colanic/teichoic acid biosynthesis glycosyltransferase
VARRALDLVLSLLALVAAAPVLLAAAAAIRLASPGPVLYRAARVGRGRRPFTMYKLRTMHVARRGAPAKIAASAITAPDDPRVFPVGALLRRTKIDELPQLLNILRGDMAIVGPRPEDPRLVADHYGPLGLATLEVRPGLTSPGSVWYYGSAEGTLAEDDPERHYVESVLPLKLALDLVYVQRSSWHYDLALIGRTVRLLAEIALGRRAFPAPPEMAAARRLLALDGGRAAGESAVAPLPHQAAERPTQLTHL